MGYFPAYFQGYRLLVTPLYKPHNTLQSMHGIHKYNYVRMKGELSTRGTSLTLNTISKHTVSFCVLEYLLYLDWIKVSEYD